MLPARARAFAAAALVLAFSLALGTAGCRSSTPSAPAGRHLFPTPAPSTAAAATRNAGGPSLTLLPVVVAAAYNREELVLRVAGEGSSITLTDTDRWARLPGDLLYDHLLERLRTSDLPVEVRRPGQALGGLSLAVELRRLEAVEGAGAEWKGVCELWATLSMGRKPPVAEPTGGTAGTAPAEPRASGVLLDRAFSGTAGRGADGAAAAMDAGPFDLAGRALERAIDLLLREVAARLAPRPAGEPAPAEPAKRE
ncbi:MAG: membrane integrity-associated transporter subunit PqiC [Planctomycetes bacterium]|nr:membrane integrity-associated transporter subunit PqiC [Planctomycetota bacterium]